MFTCLDFRGVGLLALQYALTQPKCLASLVIASGLASIPLWIIEIAHLINQLPIEVQQTIQMHEAAGTTDSLEYRSACRTFYQRYMGPFIDPTPEWFEKAFETGINQEVTNTLYGPEEFVITGRLKDWDITSQLGKIGGPVLLLSGRHDIVTFATLEPVQRAISGCEWVIFENSAHYAYIDEAERFFQVLGQFLSRVESRE